MDELPQPDNEKWTLYGIDQCLYCFNSKSLLQAKFPDNFVYHNIDNYKNARKILTERTDGYDSIPVIYHQGELIGGYVELRRSLNY